jgi:hypothetical protein
MLTARPKHAKDDQPILIGWREKVSLPQLGVGTFSAKIDTGARTSSLHAVVLDDFTREGERFVRFAVDWDGVRHQCEAVHIDVRGITSSNGEQQKRFVIKTPLTIGSLTFRAEISLADRSQMQFPMLIGRTALRRRMVVDSGHSWLQSPAIAHMGRNRR